MKKRIWLALTVVCAGLFATMSVSAATYGDLTYEVTDGKVTITGFLESDTSVAIPETINDYPVTAIGDYAFSTCGSLESITIPSSVTNIGEEAFSFCGKVKNVTLSEGLKSIGKCAFYDCSSLTNITIPDSVTHIGEAAFSCCGVTKINIPAGLTSISDRAFMDCKSLESVNFSDGIQSIGTQVFSGCSSLAEANIPGSVTTIDNFAFFSCDTLKRVNLSNKVTHIGSGTFALCDALEKVYYIGTEDEWKDMSIGEDNENLTSANIVFLNISIIGATSTDDSLKFISRANCDDQVAILSFGTTFIPLWLFDDTTAEAAIAEYDNADYNIEYGQTFGATLTGIPESCKDMAIVGKSFFVRANGDCIWSTAKSASVNDTSLADVE